MPDSPFDALVDSFRDARTQMRDAVRSVRADIIHPADPYAEKMSKTERLQDVASLINDPVRLESEFMRLRDRYKLTDDKPIPRRLVEYLRQGHREQLADSSR